MHLLFSYGTLRNPRVQRVVFAGEVTSTLDSLPGFRLEQVAITDPGVIATSGSDSHPILRPGSADDVVAGACLELDDTQLAAADRYEVADYTRVAATAGSGRQVWVYVAAADVTG